MKVNKALELVRFYTGTLSDISGKAVNPLFTNKVILEHLQFQLNTYANVTKALEDVFSFPLNTQIPFITAPELSLRSEAYKFIMIVIQGRYFPADVQDFAKSYVNFPYASIQGITSWLLPWGIKDNNFLYVFPMNSTTPTSTTLTGNITPTDTTIPVTSTAGFLTNNGRLTIGSEKILYGKVDSTNFYDCKRGMEFTTASSHVATDIATEHNVYLFYSRLHRNITITTDDFVPPAIQEIELEITDEHVQGILKATTYDLLLKVDVQRAEPYKVDSEVLYDKYRMDIKKGRSRIRSGTGIRNPYAFESGVPFYTSLY